MNQITFFFNDVVGASYQNLNQPNEAMKYFKKAYKLDKKSSKICNALATVYKDIDDSASAEKYYKKALRLDSKNLDAFNNLGVLYKSLNKKKEALECFYKVLELDPSDMNIHRNITTISKTDKDSKHLKQMLELQVSVTDKKQKCQLFYALAKAHEDIGDYEKFFYYLNIASELRIETSDYIFQKEVGAFRLLKLFHKKQKEKKIPKEMLVAGKTPIFIVGMPRSGTTLTEQILSSHSKVHGAGELNYLSTITTKLIEEELASESYKYEEGIANVRSEYYKALSAHKIKEPMFVDKMPDNFKLLHFIMDAFPEAKVVHLNRDPMAVCWSMYKQFFNSGLYYSCNQRYLGKYHKMYQHIMKYWSDNYGDRIYQLNYEALTQNQEEETRKLLEYCGLPWEDSCLDFHKNKRAVATASNQQVRKGMYTGSSQAWKKYEEYLQDMIKELEDKYTPLEDKEQNQLHAQIVVLLRKTDQRMKITKTAKNSYANSLASKLPKKQAPKSAKIENTVTINGKNYLIGDFTDEAREYLTNYKAAEDRIVQLRKKIKILLTAFQQ